MSTSDLTKFPGGTQDKGLNNFEPAIDAEISWDNTTFNVTGGVRRGVGVRYGMAPLAGQSNTETLTATETAGLMKGEGNASDQLSFRTKSYACVPLVLTINGAPRQYYAWVIGRNNSGFFFDVVVSSTKSSTNFTPASTITAGFSPEVGNSTSFSENDYRWQNILTDLTTGSKQVATEAVIGFSGAALPNYVSTASLSVSGKNWPMRYTLGRKVGTDPDINTAPNVNFTRVPVSGGAAAVFVYAGLTSEYQLENYLSAQRPMKLYCVSTNGTALMGYSLTVPPNSTTFNPATSVTDSSTAMLDVAAIAAVKIGASTAYSSVVAVVVEDPSAVTNSSYKSILVATGGIPFAVLFQEWAKNSDETRQQFFDLRQNGMQPPAQNTGTYTELGAPKSTCFANFPLWDGTTALAPVTGLNVELIGPAVDSGYQLEPTTDYELTYSVFHKRLGFETNVGAPAVFRTGAGPGNFALKIADPNATELTIFGNYYVGSDPMLLPFLFTDNSTYARQALNINDIEYRFYYRPRGQFEWLPAARVDAARWWFGADMTDFNLFTAPVAGPTGGQPDAYNDYSPLPNDTYDCVVTYKNRVFWFAEKSAIFSLQNNVFAYARRNALVIEGASYRGAIIHILPGVLNQNSRMIIFTGTATYVVRFTGEQVLQSVRVSAVESAQFPIDGSDIEIDFLTDAIAYSHRAAVVADGILYFWGPQGIYRDEGLTEPKKISGALEPNIYDYVDSTKIREVHCVYNQRTKEVIWFYPPKTADATYPTHGLAYNTENGNFYPQKYRSQVDASQAVKIENDASPAGVAGERVLVHARASTAATLQRPFFFDSVCAAGEQGPTRELLIKTISTPATGQRRLTIASGSIGVTAGDIAINDLISFQNVKGYATTLTVATDMIAKVIAVNNGAGTIDVLLPDDGDLDAAATLAQQLAFPVYQKKPTTAGLHGITYIMQTNYWLPAGMSESWVWQYLYFLFKYSGIPTPTNPFTGLPAGTSVDLTYRTLVCRAALTDTLRLKDNSTDHCQIHHPLRNEGRAANGQALAYALSGIHIGDPWTLEYLEAHCLKERGFTLKEFEG